MANFIYLISIILLRAYLTEQFEKVDFLSRERINNINSIAKTWKAGENFDPNTPKEVIIGLMGSIGFSNISRSLQDPVKTSDPLYDRLKKIYETFDARKHWSHCKTMGVVRNQGRCGSCWALSTTGAFADRLCVATNGKYNQLVSAEELAFCCHTCGFGCKGGISIEAWKYFKKHGLVSGGNYNTHEGCQPYQVPPCFHGHKRNGSCSRVRKETNHKCHKKCYGNTTIDYKSDHVKTKDAYFLSYESMQKDVQTYGPIEASFKVYDDFFHYKSGVYHKTEGAVHTRNHAVKLIGWGVENGVKYWLLVNSWGTEWGDHGLFKIRRGTNECGIEESSTAGVPLV
ncbi:unnamed protein product [Aphis gossypii]|uniref:Peptidase C1A papain C-terminal domain-containing protein n=1 Tax=Aphis gossypii TaxID=80765 RepID=A0A9P0J744_APHGO|nr:unnamed protein product [Aphis gossypii]